MPSDRTPKPTPVASAPSTAGEHALDTVMKEVQAGLHDARGHTFVAAVNAERFREVGQLVNEGKLKDAWLLCRDAMVELADELVQSRMLREDQLTAWERGAPPKHDEAAARPVVSVLVSSSSV